MEKGTILMTEEGPKNWAIRNTQYFDSNRGELVRADIEIEGTRIARITPPNWSNIGAKVHGEAFVCMPGFVSVDASEFWTAGMNRVISGEAREEHVTDLGSRKSERMLFALTQAMLCGYTTFGVFADDPVSVGRMAEQIGARAVVHLTCSDRWLGEGQGPQQRPWDEFVRSYLNHLQTIDDDTLSIGVGIESLLCVSPELAVQLHRFGKARACHFIARVNDGTPFTRNFLDAYACSGARLLENLGVLDETTTLIFDGRVGSSEWRLIKRSGAAVIRPLAPRSYTDSFESATPGGDLGLPVTLAGPIAPGDAVGLVSRLTREAADALGLRAVGSITPGMPADIQFHQRLVQSNGNGTSTAALVGQALSNRPAHVLTNGRWTVRNYGCCTAFPTTSTITQHWSCMNPDAHVQQAEKQA